MFLLVSGGHICAPQSDTNMASPYKALEKWVKRFSEYFAYELPHRPDSWQGFLFIYLLSGAPNDNFRKNICSENDFRSRIFGTFVVKFLACLPLLGFSDI